MTLDAIDAICNGDDISEDRSYHMMMDILNGVTSEEQNLAMLNGMCAKGETDDEISGMLSAMRKAAVTVDIANPNAIDVCGTGGDGLHTVNISTAAAFVASSMGCSVAKHGNRSSSGAVGSADIFEALGCNLQEEPEQIASCMKKTNVCFMFAPHHHPSMKHIAKARMQIGKRTVFNLLGPLCNPARVKRHLVGVPSEDLLWKIPRILLKNGSKKVLTVTSESGIDELSTASSSHILESDSEGQNEYTFTPRELGLQRCSVSELQVADKKDALEKFVGAIDGHSSRPVYETVALNAGAAMITAGLCKNISEGLESAMDAIKSGKAAKHLEAYVKYSGSIELLEKIYKNA